jgi:hypothetical protein
MQTSTMIAECTDLLARSIRHASAEVFPVFALDDFQDTWRDYVGYLSTAQIRRCFLAALKRVGATEYTP